MPKEALQELRERVLDLEKLSAGLNRRAEMTPKERAADNVRLREAAKAAPKTRGSIAPLMCATCLARLTTVASMDRHRDEVGHHRFYILLEEL